MKTEAKEEDEEHKRNLAICGSSEIFNVQLIPKMQLWHLVLCCSPRIVHSYVSRARTRAPKEEKKP